MKVEELIDDYLEDDIRTSGEFNYDEVVKLMNAARRVVIWKFIFWIIITIIFGYMCGNLLLLAVFYQNQFMYVIILLEKHVKLV